MKLIWVTLATPIFASFITYVVGIANQTHCNQLEGQLCANIHTSVTSTEYHVDVTCSATRPTEWVHNSDGTRPVEWKEYTTFTRPTRGGPAIGLYTASINWTHSRLHTLLRPGAYLKRIICQTVANHSDNVVVDLKPTIGKVEHTQQRNVPRSAGIGVESVPNRGPPCRNANFTVVQIPTGIWWRCDIPGARSGSIRFQNCTSAAYCANMYRRFKESPECVTVLTQDPELKGWRLLSDPMWFYKDPSYDDRAGVALCVVKSGESGTVTVAAMEYFFIQGATVADRRIAFSLQGLPARDLIRLDPVPRPGPWYTREKFEARFRVPFYGFAHQPVASVYINGTEELRFTEFGNGGGVFWSQTVTLVFAIHGPGVYRIECLAAVWNTTEIANHSTTFEVRQDFAPHFERTAENITFVEGEADQLLICDASGDPVPSYTWKGLEALKGTVARPSGPVLILEEVSRDLHQLSVNCVATNRFGEGAAKEFTIQVNSRTNGNTVSFVSMTTIAISVTLGAVIVVTLLLAIIWAVCKYPRLRSAVTTLLTDEEVREFLEGRAAYSRRYVAAMDADLFPEAQDGGEDEELTIECLPYNSKYEVGKERFFVDLSCKLGSGQYGVVFKGHIKSHPAAEEGGDEAPSVDAAVKTVRPNVPVEYFKALMSELKILAYIGNHDNIARLIGAYSSNIKNRELYVGIELCSGSLLQFLQDNRHNFKYYLGHAAEFRVAETCFTANTKTMTTADLVRWASEIAAGMEFLAQRRVVHGDLAARNVLLSFELQAKICDFGLARQLIDYAYIKSTRCSLPWKWMAIESLTQMHFSTASDVWSYGVTCWEIFSLGEVPYPCMAWSWDFVAQLEGGQRLPRAKYASVAIHNLLLECWHEDRQKRPKIGALREFFEGEKAKLANE